MWRDKRTCLSGKISCDYRNGKQRCRRRPKCWDWPAPDGQNCGKGNDCLFPLRWPPAGSKNRKHSCWSYTLQSHFFLLSLSLLSFKLWSPSSTTTGPSPNRRVALGDREIRQKRSHGTWLAGSRPQFNPWHHRWVSQATSEVIAEHLQELPKYQVN